MTALAVDSSAPYQAIPFDPEKHAEFVYSSFKSQTNVRAGVLRGLLMREGARCLVAADTEDPDILLGWCAAMPRNRLVFAYTKFMHRKQWGIASSLAMALGIDFSKPVLVLFWTRAAARIAMKPNNPYHLVPAPRKEW